jgi:hypothetical protein
MNGSRKLPENTTGKYVLATRICIIIPMSSEDNAALDDFFVGGTPDPVG